MGINLKKGGRSDIDYGLSSIGIGLGWDINDSDTGQDYDLDASVFMLDKNGKIPNDNFFIFYNNLKSSDGSVEHQGDNRTGEGEGDDETILVNLDKVDSKIEELVIVVTIDEAITKSQNFGQVDSAFVRIYDNNTHRDLIYYELDEDFSTETSIEVGRIYKKNNSWKFKATGSGFEAGLQMFVDKFQG